MKKQNIFIDTDMGNDDIMAICQLLFYPSIDIVGISVVNGVATKTSGYKNLQLILNYLSISIPSQLGYQNAIKEKNATFPSRDIDRANNLTLLKNLQIKNMTNQINTSITIEDFIFKQTFQNQATILALGPLTNLAKTIEKYGIEFTKNIKQIVMMGGAVKKGNVAPNFFAEYNMWLDPEAAQIVFSSGIPILMVGIDATNCAKVTEEFVNEIKKTQPKDKKAKIIREIIINNNNDFDAFYDPLTSYILVDPSIITKKTTCRMNISLNGKTRGQTIPIISTNSNIDVVLRVEPNTFYRQLKAFMASTKSERKLLV